MTGPPPAGAARPDDASQLPGVHRPRLARGTMLNLLAMGAPIVTGVIAVPVLVRGLGTDRFGVLALAWTLTGYFGLFDLGLGRALTQLVAARVGATGAHVAPRVVWPALGLMVALGVAGAVVLAALAPWLAQDALQVPAPLVEETRRALQVLAAGIPMIVATSAFAGLLAAFHEFGTLNAVRAPMWVMMLLAPALVLPFSTSLVAVAWAMVAVRVAALLAMAAASRRFLPARGSPAEVGPRVGALFGVGAWMTVSNVVSPVLVHLDRVLIGSMVSMAAVAWYATPYEVVTKAFVVPGAVVGVLFPAFSVSAGRDAARMERLFLRGVKYLALLIFPAVLVAVAFAPEGLALWVGAEFARQGAPVLRWIAIGVFVNCAAQVCFALVQGAGRADLTARFHLLELPPYVLLLWWCIGRWGITGAAAAWTVRVTVDAALLLAASGRLLALRGAVVGRVAAALAALAGALALPLLLDGVAARAALVLAMVTAFLVAGWRAALAPDERARFVGMLGALVPAGARR